MLIDLVFVALKLPVPTEMTQVEKIKLLAQPNTVITNPD